MQNRFLLLILLLIGVVYVCNLKIDIMEVDAAQYAAMSAEMHQTGSYLQVFHRGVDYLDKPPLLFWLSSASFGVFGVNTIAYKLPAVLVLLLGLWATFKFTRLYYNRDTALIAVTILATSQAYFLMTNDVRTDGLLTGFVMFAVYHCAAYLNQKQLSSLIWAGIAVGLAMLAKGPIGAIIPVVAIVADRLLKGRWKDLFDARWIVVIVVGLIVLLPMCYGLYQQFDLHPEKTTYGLQSPSGLKFFFWTQSFGRITGDIYWDNNAPWYFFLLTILWDFMPWVILFFAALFFAFRLISRDRKGYSEYMTVGGFILVLILLSFSRYKLPHYIFPLLPFAAILTARFLEDGLRRNGRGFAITQLVIMHIFFFLMGFAFLKAFPAQTVVLPIICLAGFIALWIFFVRLKDQRDRIFITACITAITFNLFMSLHFYPHLMRYQSGAQAGRAIKTDMQQSKREYYAFDKPSYTLDFYSGHFRHVIDRAHASSIPIGSWIYITEEGLAELEKDTKMHYKVIHTYDHYHVSMLKLDFVLQDRRPKTLKKRYLVEKIE